VRRLGIGQGAFEELSPFLDTGFLDVSFQLAKLAFFLIHGIVPEGEMSHSG
jgi:hypothetical protein